MANYFSRPRRLNYLLYPHSCPQNPQSFWSAPGIETSGHLQHQKSVIHGLIVKSHKSDWLKSSEQVLCACSKIGSGQRSQSLAQTRRIFASGSWCTPSQQSNAKLQCHFQFSLLELCETLFKESVQDFCRKTL